MTEASKQVTFSDRTADAPKENDLQALAKQCNADSELYFPAYESARSSSTGRLFHYGVGMSTESNEFLEIIKKVDRGSLDYNDPQVREALKKEAVDSLIYLMNAFGEMGIDPLEAYNEKRAFNNGRFIKKAVINDAIA